MLDKGLHASMSSCKVELESWMSDMAEKNREQLEELSFKCVVCGIKTKHEYEATVSRFKGEYCGGRVCSTKG